MSIDPGHQKKMKRKHAVKVHAETEVISHLDFLPTNLVSLVKEYMHPPFGFLIMQLQQDLKQLYLENHQNTVTATDKQDVTATNKQDLVSVLNSIYSYLKWTGPVPIGVQVKSGQVLMLVQEHLEHFKDNWVFKDNQFYQHRDKLDWYTELHEELVWKCICKQSIWKISRCETGAAIRCAIPSTTEKLVTTT